MSSYKILSKQKFESGGYAIVPIRMEDRYAIMQWRNEQIYHLRQDKPLTKEEQEKYFNEVVINLFEQEKPAQILFSYLNDGHCIGYGGLVHINWIDKNAEISFVMDTSLENEFFEFQWSTYLSLIEEVAFKELDLHKIYTYAFDLRPRLYTALDKRGFRKEAQLVEHSLFDGKYIDVLIHTKFKNSLILREASTDDLDATYQWVNDEKIRAYAYNQNKITKDAHLKWFTNKLKSDECSYFILEERSHQVGSIRFDIEKHQETAKISYLVDPKFTGQGYGTFLLEKGVAKLKTSKPNLTSVYGHVLKENFASVKIFEKLGYKIMSKNESELKFEKKLQ